MTLESLNAYLENERSKKSGGYPSGMHYKVTEKTVGVFELCVENASKNGDVWQVADAWGFAVFDEIREKLNGSLGLRFAMPVPSDKNMPKYEALKRRLSYLAEFNKKIPVALSIGCREEPLYPISALNKRPDNEVIRQSFKKRDDKDEPGRLEKDFQVYLFGKGLHKDNKEEIRTNERLALFGKDFSFIKSRKNVFCVEREFPTGVFYGEVKKETRILPTEFIDLVTINKYNEVAIIELKFDDAKLEVIAQLLNYALFFHSYKAQLTPLLDARLHCSSKNFHIKAYLVSNVFHQRFDAVWPYYNRGCIAMRQIVMGYMPDN